jgi:hypothetical protein
LDAALDAAKKEFTDRAKAEIPALIEKLKQELRDLRGQ